LTEVFNSDFAEFYSCVVGFLNLRDEVINRFFKSNNRRSDKEF